MTIISVSAVSTESIAREAMEDNFKLGNWFWVLDSSGNDAWLGCIMKMGSNFIEVEEPHYQHISHKSTRVHFSDAYKKLRFEPNAIIKIADQVSHYQSQSADYMKKIQDLTARLGVDLRPSLGHKNNTGTELMLLNRSVNIDDHKQELIQMKEIELPDLFNKLKKTNEELARWMSASAMPQLAAFSEMKESIGVIDDRIFNISLYAGLAENVKLCADGEPAPFGEKLRVMQRRLYMDEECLLDYRTGGMTFTSLRQYDEWLSKPINRDRILPFPRCITAMRVRRNTLDRGAARDYAEAMARMSAEFNDKLTYLYIRNGEKVYRLETDVEFDEMIFPDSFEENEPLMVRLFCQSLKETITRRDYEERLKAYRIRCEQRQKWFDDNPREVWEAANPSRNYFWANPHGDRDDFNPKDWSPFDSTNIYFDECAKTMAKRVKHFNYVALLIQGLFDRSEVLHPHPIVKSWEADSFAENIELIYDASRAIMYGDAPDFEVYRAKCNEQFKTGSISAGQQVYWEMHEAKKECDRLDRSYRERNSWRPSRFKPEGNPGMGFVAPVAAWNAKAKTAKFTWKRDRLRNTDRYGLAEQIDTSITIPAEYLFNISAYKKGDYLQFFKDPRTREKYLKWAPLLMEAENYVRRNEDNPDQA